MRNFVTYCLLLIFSSSILSQETVGITGNKNWFNGWTNFKPKTALYDESTNILSGVINKNTTLTKTNTYLLTGVVYVVDNAVLTIEPGTVIRGDYDTCGTLVITKGAKINALGTETDPIIFTSNKAPSSRNPGDWGGLILFGDAPINKYGGASTLDFNLNQSYSFFGGNNTDSDSGILKFVRFEFCGRKLNATKELNGLSLAGVGKKTVLENIQISYSNDDSFECYGGNVNFSNLISFRATDDDFDFTMGVQCQIQNSIAIRYPFSSDVSRSRCFEIDSYDKIDQIDFSKKLFTTIEAKNITLINNEENDQGLVKEAIFIKKNSFFTLKNSIINGFEKGLLFEKEFEVTSLELEKVKLENVQLNLCKGFIENELPEKNNLIEQWYKNQKFLLTTSKTNKIDLFFETDIKKTPDFRLKIPNSVTNR